MNSFIILVFTIYFICISLCIWFGFLEKEKIPFRIWLSEYFQRIILILVFLTLLFVFYSSKNIFSYFVNKLALLQNEIHTTFQITMISCFTLIGISLYFFKIYTTTKKASFNRFFIGSLLFFIYMIFKIKIPELNNKNIISNSFQIYDLMGLSIIWLIGEVMLRLDSYLNKKKEEDKINKKGFYHDEPILLEGKDKFQRSFFAQDIIEKIKKTNNQNNAFNIGIVGEWGAGKSSFINLMKKELDKDKLSIISMNFNPWFNHSEENIILDFFKTLNYHIKPYDGEIASLLWEYVDKLVPSKKGLWVFMYSMIMYSKSNRTAQMIYDEITEKLKNIDQKLIIFIDDLDRLHKNEIAEILKLIRNTANFPNTYFIVTYDKKYVIQAIDEINSHNKEKYLEKIFQFTFDIPLIPNYVLKNELMSEIIENEMINYEEPFNAHLDHILSGFILDLHLFIKNKRDIIRLINHLKIINKEFTEKNQEEVYLLDLILVELLKFLDYDTFLQIRNKIEEYPISAIEGELISILVLKETKKKTKKKRGLCCELDENKDLKKITDNILKRLFDNRKILRSSNSIQNPIHFNKYINSQLFIGDFSITKFTKARVEGFEELCKLAFDYLPPINIEKHPYTFFQKDPLSLTIINDVKYFKDKKDFMNISETIKFIFNERKNRINANVRDAGVYGNDIIEYFLLFLATKKMKYLDAFKEVILEDHTSVLGAFILRRLNYNFLDNNVEQTYFKHSDVIKSVKINLKKALHYKLYEIALEYYWSGFDTTDSQNSFVMNSEVNNIVEEHIQSNPTFLFKFFIVPYSSSNPILFHINYDFVKQILNETEEDQYLKTKDLILKFKDDYPSVYNFFLKYEKQNYKPVEDQELNFFLDQID